jgi:Periplasmic binding protein-like domain
MFLFQNQSSLSPNSSRSELLVHMDCIMKSVLQKNGALTSYMRLRKRRAEATGSRNRLHIFDSCSWRIATPEDVSAIGFDDIQVAAYNNPRLTTIRQPQHHMGETAAHILLHRMQGFKDYPVKFAVPPVLIIRETTASPNANTLRRRVRP